MDPNKNQCEEDHSYQGRAGLCLEWCLPSGPTGEDEQEDHQGHFSLGLEAEHLCGLHPVTLETLPWTGQSVRVLPKSLCGPGTPAESLPLFMHVFI